VAINPEGMAPQVPEGLFVTSYFLAYFNRGLNAIIYGLLNQNFRREYKRILLTSGTRGAVCRVVPRAATPRVYRARFRLGFMIGTWSRQMRSSLD
jgi:hypothetical protein